MERRDTSGSANGQRSPYTEERSMSRGVFDRTVVIRVRLAAPLLLHCALGALVTLFALVCCGPDIAGADRLVEILGPVSWLAAAIAVVWFARTRAAWLTWIPPLVWFAAMIALYWHGVREVAY